MALSRGSTVYTRRSGLIVRLSASVIVPNHGRDISALKASVPTWVEFIEVNMGLERSAQRNIGIKKAKGDVLFILDSDQILKPGTIEECLEVISMGYSAVYIPETIVGCRLFTRIRAFERRFLNYTAVDVPRCVLRRICPLFDETMSGPEDSDWANRIPGIFGRCVDGVMYHFDDIPFCEYIRKKAYYTKSMKRYKEKNPNDRCTNLKYRVWDVYTENGKWKKLLRHPLMAIGIIFILILRGVIYYANKG